MGLGAMIPIVTKECGVDIEGFGIGIEDLTINAVQNSISKAINLSDEVYSHNRNK